LIKFGYAVPTIYECGQTDTLHSSQYSTPYRREWSNLKQWLKSAYYPAVQCWHKARSNPVNCYVKN